jgi:saccharopine dehydrogenase-like NADP-dependent oxidoreductase
MKFILVLGAGKSATCLIEYLIKESYSNKWDLTVADGNLELAKSKLGNSPVGKAIGVNIENSEERRSVIEKADIVVSLLPPHLHAFVAKDCVVAGKHLLTASYVDDEIKSLEPEIKKRGLIFLCEMGLDPGIDHMSAMQLVNRIKQEGGKIKSFKSHCGGLVAPESDDNPWRYKISWNPRNIVMAGKAGGTFRENGAVQVMSYPDLFDANRVVEVADLGYLAWYPNRDSLSYIPLYHLEETETFVRTTLRFPEFCFGWRNVIDLKLTDETPQYDTDEMNLQQFFQLHFNKYGFSEWLEKQLTSRFSQTKQLLEKLQQLLEAEQEVEEEDRQELQEFMMIDDNGELLDINIDKVKTQAAATVAGQMHEANLSMKQLFYLGMDDNKTQINKGKCSALDVLQFAVEKKLSLKPEDKDMIVMLHEFEYTLKRKKKSLRSLLIVKGEDSLRTAMAKTVGLPLGIAVKLIMQGKIKTSGLHIPTLPEIYEPVLEELEENGIKFQETVSPL